MIEVSGFVPLSCGSGSGRPRKYGSVSATLLLDLVAFVCVYAAIYEAKNARDKKSFLIGFSGIISIKKSIFYSTVPLLDYSLSQLLLTGERG